MHRQEQQSPPDEPRATRRRRWYEVSKRAFAALCRLDRGALALVLALCPALWVSWPLLTQTPLSYDHATHLFKAWHFWEEMLGRGRVRGWSHYWAFGTPTNELVPFGSEAWVALFRAATFAQLSWLRTYAIAFAGLMFFKTIAAYCFTRVFLGRAAAVVCAWITVLDPGGMLEGGWEWHTYWGVWPVTLAMSFALLALARLEAVLRAGRTRDVFWAGSFLAAALLTHPMALIAMLIAVPLLLLDHALRRQRAEPLNVARALASLVFGVALSSFYLLPFFARSGEAQDLGWLGDSLPVTSQKLLELKTFQNVSAPVHALALLGGWLALRRRVPGAIFLGMAGAVLVLLSSGVLIRDLHLERVLPSLIKIEANRFLLVAKLFWFALAGYGLGQLVLPRLGTERGGERMRRGIGWALGAGLALVLLAPGWRHFYDTQIAKNIVSEQQRRYFGDLQKMLAHTRDLRLASNQHYRVAYNMWRNEHISTLAPVFDPSLVYKVGYTPVQIFEKVPMSDDTALLEKLSVKYVVSSTPLGLPVFQQEKRFGDLRLYRFLNFHSEPFSLVGAGKGELLEFSPERVRIRLSETAPGSRLNVHVASYARWQATFGGEVLPITTVPAFGAEYPMLMEVPARDGELVLDYVYRGVDWAGLLVTWAALPSFLMCVWFGRRQPLLGRAVARVRGWARPLAWSALGLGLGVAATAAAGTRTRDRLLPPESIFRRLQSPGDMTLGDEACVETSPLSFKCGAQRVKADVVAGAWGLHLCMTAPDAGDLRVRAHARLGSFLAGHYDPLREGPGSISVSVNGEPLGTLVTRPAYLRHQHIQFDTRAHRGETALVEVVLAGTARNCFDLGTQD